MTEPIVDLAAYDATLQHISLINVKLCRLLTVQAQAETQLVHRLASDYEAGRIGLREIYETYMRIRPMAVDGFTKRWDARMPERLQARRVYHLGSNLPDADGNWRGPCPLPPRDPAPPNGQSVVYVLFDAQNVPCYVGSSEQFRTRLKSHMRDGKDAAHWLAYPCADREAAYVLEERLLHEHKPYLNRRRGR